MKTNQIIHGNCIEVLKRLPKNSIHLIYLDPPFFSNREHQGKTRKGKIHSFNDKWESGLLEYLDFMREVMNQCHRVLKQTGSIYLHCDWHASHYLKIEMDKMFGYNKFRNEIIWRRHNSHNDTKQGAKIFGRVHDSILFYSKGNNPIWSSMYQKYSNEHIRKAYRHVEKETGRLYAHGDLSGPGGATKGNPCYKFRGVIRYWRYNKKKMLELYRKGKIIQTHMGRVPVLKRYLDEMNGIQLQDVWDDIQSVQVSKKESVGYPTQKPIKLLERIIEVSSNRGDIVLDPFCGSGTTLLAANNLDRKWLGIDKSHIACRVAKTRIQQRKEHRRLVEISA